MAKKCNNCARTDVIFLSKRAVCKDCYNLSRRNKTVEKSEDFALILAEVSEIRALVVDLRNVNAGLRNENYTLKEMLRPSLDDSILGLVSEMQAEINEVRSENKRQTDVLADMRLEIIELQNENKVQRELLQNPKRIGEGDALARIQAEIKEVRNENNGLRELLHVSVAKSEKYLKETLQKDLRYELIAKIQAEIKELRELSPISTNSNCEDVLVKIEAEIKELWELQHAQNGRLDGIVQMYNEIRFAAPPKYSADIASDLESRCGSIENSLEKLEKAQTELTEEQKQHAKYTKIGFETIRSQFGDDKFGNKVLAAKIDALTTVVAKLEDPDKTPKPSPKTSRKASTPKKQ